MPVLVELDFAYWVELGDRLRDLNPDKFSALLLRIHHLVQAESALAAIEAPCLHAHPGEKLNQQQ